MNKILALFVGAALAACSADNSQIANQQQVSKQIASSSAVSYPTTAQGSARTARQSRRSGN